MAKKIDIDTKTFVRFWLVIFGLVLVASFIVKAWTGILLVLIAAFLAVALHPLAKKLDRFDKKHKRSSLSSVMAVVLVVVAVVAVVALVGPIVVGEVGKFANQAPAEIEAFSQRFDLDSLGRGFGIDNLRDQIVSAVQDLSGSIMNNLGSVAFNSISAIGNFMTGAVLVIVLTVLFMLQGNDLMNKMWESLKRRKGAKTVKVWQRVVSRVARVISKYVSGQALVAVLDGMATMLIVFVLSLCFSAVPMSFVVPLGLLAMVMFMIPMFGPVINCVVAALLLAVNSLWAALIYVVVYLVYEQIENNMISPKIQGKGMGLSPLVILVAITIGMYAFGILGTFIAIPVAGCIKVLIEESPNIKALSE